jgi:hypothetical protein
MTQRLNILLASSAGGSADGEYELFWKKTLESRLKGAVVTCIGRVRDPQRLVHDAKALGGGPVALLGFSAGSRASLKATCVDPSLFTCVAAAGFPLKDPKNISREEELESTLPVLLLSGSRDEYTTRAGGHDENVAIMHAAAATMGEGSSFVELAGADHGLRVKKVVLDKAVDALVAFFKAHAQGGEGAAAGGGGGAAAAAAAGAGAAAAAAAAAPPSGKGKRRRGE